ncbi:FapA family protein [Halalkalibacter krulwichiae]|uniref:FapA family protein n=1 Tax=Halalkalibacter krulwichiae TaxID=199441 RepID=UPI0021476775|nr:FapA family protein [Halalkalibacter krulwichiae]
MKTIISKGKNINEAIQRGLIVLNATIEDVTIEIVQNEAKGFLKIGSRDAIVKLIMRDSVFSPKSEASTQTDSHTTLEDIVNQIPTKETDWNEQEAERNVANHFTEETVGKAWVKDGQLYVKSAPKQLAMITITDGVKLLKDEQVIKERKVIVTENETYVLQTKNEQTPTKWSIKLSPQKLKVLLHVEPGYKLTRSIPDHKPEKHLTIHAKQIKEAYNELTYDIVLQKLHALKISRGVNEEAIREASQAKTPGSFEIATGLEAKQGKDGWVEALVQLKMQQGPKELENGRVDFRDSKEIPSVKVGEVVGIVHPPIAGQDGWTVTNEQISSKPTYPVNLVIGKGMELVNELLVAIEAGRPHLEQRGRMVKVKILRKLTHRGNVDITTGNIRFTGDVEVIGNIDESMLVEAEGDIIVHKEVNQATVTASGAVFCYGNVSGSELSAGKNNMIVAELGKIVGPLSFQTENIIAAIRQLIQSPAFKNGDFSIGGLQPLIRILLEKKFKSFSSLAKKYVKVVRKADRFLEREEWKEVSSEMAQVFLSISSKPVSVERVVQLSQKLKELYQVSQTPVEPDSSIILPSAANSSLFCSGDISITGKGCVNTKIHASGHLTINGIVRGEKSTAKWA